MKRKAILSLVAASLLGLATTPSHGAETTPDYLDFSAISPARDGQLVDVDLDEGLLSLAAVFAAPAEKEASDILKGLKHVRVHVIALDDANRTDALRRIEAARTGLARDGWKRLVTVKDNNEGDVMVFARMEDDHAIKGIAVTVIDGSRQAVVVNVTGDIRPEQIAALGARFDIAPLRNLKLAKQG